MPGHQQADHFSLALKGGRTRIGSEYLLEQVEHPLVFEDPQRDMTRLVGDDKVSMAARLRRSQNRVSVGETDGLPPSLGVVAFAKGAFELIEDIAIRNLAGSRKNGSDGGP